MDAEILKAISEAARTRLANFCILGNKNSIQRSRKIFKLRKNYWSYIFYNGKIAHELD